MEGCSSLNNLIENFSVLVSRMRCVVYVMGDTVKLIFS